MATPFPNSSESPWTNPDNGLTYTYVDGVWVVEADFVKKSGDIMTGGLASSGYVVGQDRPEAALYFLDADSGALKMSTGLYDPADLPKPPASPPDLDPDSGNWQRNTVTAGAYNLGYATSFHTDGDQTIFANVSTAYNPLKQTYKSITNGLVWEEIPSLNQNNKAWWSIGGENWLSFDRKYTDNNFSTVKSCSGWTNASSYLIGKNNDTGVVYAVGTGSPYNELFKSTDYGATFSKVATLSANSSQKYLPLVKKFRRSDTDTLIIPGKGNNKKIFRQANFDVEGNWEVIDHPYTIDVAVENIINSGNIWIMYSFTGSLSQNEETRGLVRSTDDGLTWEKWNLPSLYCLSDICTDDNGSWLAVGTDQSSGTNSKMWVSFDNTETWTMYDSVVSGSSGLDQRCAYVNGYWYVHPSKAAADACAVYTASNSSTTSFAVDADERPGLFFGDDRVITSYDLAALTTRVSALEGSEE